MAIVRLLVVDDFRLWRDCVQAHLEGYAKVHIAGFASDGLEALQKVGELQPDLVLLDISLPRLGVSKLPAESGNSVPVARLSFSPVT